MVVVDLSTTVAGIQLPCCVYNASGPRSGTAVALTRIASSQSGAVLSKSATLDAQTGNPQPRTWHADDGLASLNSEGLPNGGIDYYLASSTLEEFVGVDGVPSKPYIVSLSGKTLADNLEMLRRIATAPTRTKIAAIELNLACPNVIGKPIIAYDYEQMDAILTAVAKLAKASDLPPLGIKLPPYLDFQHFVQAAKVINRHKKLVRYVASINTIGNALSIDAESEAPQISSNAGYAGLSGPAVKYTALANVRKLRSLLDESIDVVGVGGIRSGQDAFEFLLAGAVACQVATCHWKEGPGCFDRISTELAAILEEKGYRSIADVRGKLKEWSREGADLSRAKSKASGKSANRGTASGGKESPGGGAMLTELQFYQALSAVLAVLLAVICASQWTGGAALLSSDQV